MVLNVPNVKFYNGNTVPQFGLGTWKSKPGEVTQAVKDAIDIGYRHIDCAHVYGNEKEVGEAIKTKIAEGVVARKDLFVTSKLWNTFHQTDLVEPAIKKTLSDLGLEYLDLYLIHWPIAYKEGNELFPKKTDGSPEFSNADYVDTWKGMEGVLNKGLTKNIGVSNFNSEQITRLLKNCKVKPVTNQVECHPYLTQKKLSDFCKEKEIVITAYSPLGSPDRPWAKPDDPKLLDDMKLLELGKKYNKTPAQILLRYQLDRGHVVIPKSVTKTRIAENSNIFDFQLKPDDIAYIDSFDCNGRICPMTGRDDKWIDLVRQSNGEDDKTSLTTVTSTIQDSILSTQSQSVRSIYDKRRDFEGHVLQRSGGGRVFSYRKKKASIGNGIFSAPAGVNPHHVASSIVRRNTGGSRLIFIWPQKVRTRGRLLTIFAPLMHGFLVGLLCMDAIHLWPGEFLPTSLPTTTPIPLPPVKCNVIEPSWFDTA